MLTILVSVVTSIAATFAINWYLVKKINDAGGCPECHTPAPQYRKANSWRQALWGGWTCENCGCDMDRRGKLLTASSH